MVRNNRLDEAQHILKRISTNTSEDEIKGTLAMMVHTVEIETQLDNEASQTSYLQCFKGTDRRRTEICCMTFMGQLFSGSCFAYTPTYFFQQAGIKDTVSYSIGLGGTAVAFCGTITSWFILAHVGRRKIYTTGMGVLCTLLLIIGIVSSASKSDDVKWVAGALTVVWLFTYSLSVGPVAYTIVSETSAIRVRAKTVCLARNSYALMNIVCSTVSHLPPSSLSSVPPLTPSEARILLHEPHRMEPQRQDRILLVRNFLLDVRMGILPTS